MGSDDDLMLMACDLPESQLNVPFELQLMPPLPGEDPREPRDFGSFQSASLSQLPDTGKPAGCFLVLVNSTFKLPRWF